MSGHRRWASSAFEATLVAALKTDAHRVRDQRRTARALFVQIQAQGYRGGYSAKTCRKTFDCRQIFNSPLHQARVAAKLCGKLCRQTLPCGNRVLMVFRLC